MHSFSHKCRKGFLLIALMASCMPGVSVGARLLCEDRSTVAAAVDADRLKQELEEYVAEQDARIGIAVVTNDGRMIAVNDADSFPMQSVYKFPLSLTVADYCIKTGRSFSDTIAVRAEEIEEGTWSPLRDKYGVRELNLPIRELLECSLQQSDNNACDILFRLTGGTQATDSLLRSMGIGGINVVWTESQMHRRPDLCYENYSTPMAMARLLEVFYDRLRESADEYREIGQMMESCATGADRLGAPLTGTNVVLGHKTGTGDRNDMGRITAINDCGYAVTADGRRLIIAVFVSDSGYDYDQTSKIIADISRMIFQRILRR